MGQTVPPPSRPGFEQDQTRVTKRIARGPGLAREQALTQGARMPQRTKAARTLSQSTSIARKSLTLVCVGPVITRSPSGSKKP